MTDVVNVELSDYINEFMVNYRSQAAVCSNCGHALAQVVDADRTGEPARQGDVTCMITGRRVFHDYLSYDRVMGCSLFAQVQKVDEQAAAESEPSSDGE